MKDARGVRDLSLGDKLAAVGGVNAIRALAKTWRYHTVGEETPQRLRTAHQPILFTLWHGQMLPLLWYHRNQGVAVLVSEHSDGEIIARILEWMGYALIRGSTSRGAGRALIGLTKTLRDGNDVAITPDGPRGPRHKFAQGAVVAANRAQVPIVPTVAHVDRSWQLSSWDGFIIPKPFARITIAYGPATRVTATTPREAAEEAPKLEQLMAETAQAACAG
ncbi:MAG TPA: lysophospholipid acyltransferase family protein [Gemmatimonadaceae bacterium]